jgi:hypothetical protein
MKLFDIYETIWYIWYKWYKLYENGKRTNTFKVAFVGYIHCEIRICYIVIVCNLSH